MALRLSLSVVRASKESVRQAMEEVLVIALEDMADQVVVLEDMADRVVVLEDIADRVVVLEDMAGRVVVL